MNGVLEFYDTSDVVCMNQAEHFMATDVEWDPTGRFVATSVSWWAHKVSHSLQCIFKYSRTSTSSYLSMAATDCSSYAPIHTELFFQNALHRLLLNCRSFILSQNDHYIDNVTVALYKTTDLFWR